ncbi:MAG TPA: hypothetical protein VFB34_09690 [Chloroflexota bacterium]|nr:hypothetical protein [Chloroflexota bacterium]
MESFPARASLSWARMEPDAAAAFDADPRRLILERVGDVVEQAVRAGIAGETLYARAGSSK